MSCTGEMSVYTLKSKVFKRGIKTMPCRRTIFGSPINISVNIFLYFNNLKKRFHGCEDSMEP